jgi:hypothetical protein
MGIMHYPGIEVKLGKPTPHLLFLSSPADQFESNFRRYGDQTVHLSAKSIKSQRLRRYGVHSFCAPLLLSFCSGASPASNLQPAKKAKNQIQTTSFIPDNIFTNLRWNGANR